MVALPWYWLLSGADGEVFSTASASLVSTGDATYTAWLAAGNLPSRIGFTDGATLGQSCSELFDVLQAQCPSVAAAVAATWIANGYLSYQQAYEYVIAKGIALTSTGVSALNATYPLDPLTISNLMGLYVGVKVGDGLPNAASSIGLPDITNTMHSFDATHLTAFALKVRDYLWSLSPGQVTAHGWPVSNAVNIA
jgi:hypothetical protein